MRLRHGFTLVELLIVVAILSLLLAMLTPMLTRARELTRRAICASNQGQIARAFSIYAADNRQMLPPIGWNDPPLGVQKTSSTYFWDMPLADKLLAEYIGQVELLYCPSYLLNNRYVEWGNLRRDRRWGDNHSAQWWWYGWPELAGYPTQWRISGYNCLTQPQAGATHRVRSINDPPNKVLLFGMEISYNDSVSPTWGNNWEREHWGNGRPDGQNVTCVDGHAAWKDFRLMTPNISRGMWWWWWTIE
ncbi:MAG: hypothetical protein BWX88_00514 [Planctomycetes bacterium ADurb.Bin126]|nr:MAG: hypothetical protein BWX88_00514 [Planctomycetes bacterium ADurb.Bin126]HOD82341.1 prepilin-type N-terminal cleavage/methylation domain-containing protein [Phycisphaerae bacterium]HQL73614.1 prepilin-type N-terminal cleavage/methylation domain-containing protein [Phycisphaerae bacterium]